MCPPMSLFRQTLLYQVTYQSNKGKNRLVTLWPTLWCYFKSRQVCLALKHGWKNVGGACGYIVSFPTTVNFSKWCLSHSKPDSLEFTTLGLKKTKGVTWQKTTQACLKGVRVTVASAVSLLTESRELVISQAAWGAKDLRFWEEHKPVAAPWRPKNKPTQFLALLSNIHWRKYSLFATGGSGTPGYLYVEWN